MRKDAVAALALTVVVASLWCLAYGRTSRGAWTTPVRYYGDAWLVLATLKTAQDGHVVPFSTLYVPELGAPFEANWNDFPNFLRQHKLQLWLAGGLCRRFGLFAASNGLLLLAHVLAAGSFYGVARYFRARPEWALAGACAFAFSPYLFYRSLDHLNLSFCWPIPLAILLVSWAFGRRGIPVGSRRFLVGLGIVFVAGIHNVYYASLLAQFLALAGFAQHLRGRRGRLVLGPWLLLLALVGTVLVDSANVLASNWNGGPRLPSQARPYGNLERYALKPIELLLPAPGWGLTPWPSLAVSYAEGALYRGEMGSAYLGLAGLAGLAWMCLSAFRGYLQRRRGFVPGALLAVAWILAYSMVGGLNGLVGALGFTWFRGTNRYSVWILALVLLWMVGRLSRAPWAGRRAASLAAAALATSIAFADQCPPGTPAAQVAQARKVMASDLAFVRALEAALPREAMIFMLPVVDSPEGDRVRKATDYENFRPYLLSIRLRFSYGSDKGRPREAWQRRVEALEAESMADALERMGFAGLLVNRKGYEDGARELRDRLAATGRLEAFESPDRDFVFIRLRPAASPLPPDAVVPPAPGSESS
ncbi:MAG TPA: hypothetical protein VE359_05465 [Vicinamibacteria bacterium]|nr:hypothetical protein [Vicinamibacteria bacterium]